MEASSIARASSALIGMADGGRERLRQLGADQADLLLDATIELGAPRTTPAPRANRAESGGVARSIASQLVSRARSSSSTRAAAAQPEQALGVQQIDDHGEVDDEADDLQADRRWMIS